MIEKEKEAKDKEREHKEREEKTTKIIVESKEDKTMIYTNIVETSERKEESNTMLISETDNSEDDAVERQRQRRELTEDEKNQKILITLSETPTTLMYFTPSTRFFINKNGIFFVLII